MDNIKDRVKVFSNYHDSFKEFENIISIPIFENKLEKIPPYTIAIPTYNRAVLLQHAINSAINQNGDLKYEIIVVDNNPERNNETETLMNKYHEVKGLSYYKNSKNIGMVGNLNRLYEISRSKIVIMLHDDDYLLPDYLIFHDNLIHKRLHEWDVILPSYYKSNSLPYKNKTKYLYNVTLSHFTYYNPVGSPAAIITNKEAIKQTGGFRSLMYPSLFLDMYIRLLKEDKKIFKVISNPTCVYRVDINTSMKLQTILNMMKDRMDYDKILNKRYNFLGRHFEKQRQRYFKANLTEYYIRFTNDIYPELQDQLKKDLKNRTLYSKLIFHILNLRDNIRMKKSRILI